MIVVAMRILINMLDIYPVDSDIQKAIMDNTGSIESICLKNEFLVGSVIFMVLGI